MQVFFFFQAEDGIRDLTVTGVQTCALPILSILQKQKSRDPSLGYAKDFIPLMERILPIAAQRGIKITANAGGVNPRACAQAVAETARRLRLGGKVRIGVVTGDDLLGRLDGLLARGHELRNLDTGRPLSEIGRAHV